MTINCKIGEIALADDLLLSGTLTRAAFSNSALALGATICIQNEPLCSFDLQPIALPEILLHVRLQFEGQNLIWVSLSHGAERFGNSWSEWSEAKEQMRMTYHERWLSQDMKSPVGDYPWGEISSIYDMKGSESTIYIY